MEWLCPVCNGYESLDAFCPQCASPLEDHGRYMDLFGDYSPYEPIDGGKLSDNLLDLHTHQCPHTTFCRQCYYSDIAMVNEQ
ncbi:hypothetical protein [Mechercharimyces sp. CAU 1602]|uniref:hypothetical protein n=1 Tax=Mechercharimyces sp. CAU 1602 TaxID=2973933 RepID=UPI0021627966|nr:hypothetical protein [Mechercharimyces sp. CAU 1602]MCS1351760.1 hypothetical protein [Mechercharimyces sp. CAU 1602]